MKRISLLIANLLASALTNAASVSVQFSVAPADQAVPAGNAVVLVALISLGLLVLAKKYIRRLPAKVFAACGAVIVGGAALFHYSELEARAPGFLAAEDPFYPDYFAFRTSGAPLSSLLGTAKYELLLGCYGDTPLTNDLNEGLLVGALNLATPAYASLPPTINNNTVLWITIDGIDASACPGNLLPSTTCLVGTRLRALESCLISMPSVI